MIVVRQVLFNPSKSLVTAMAPLFLDDDNNSCSEAGQAGSDIKCWRELLIRVGGSRHGMEQKEKNNPIG
jgi:hypothetical protein